MIRDIRDNIRRNYFPSPSSDAAATTARATTDDMNSRRSSRRRRRQYRTRNSRSRRSDSEAYHEYDENDEESTSTATDDYYYSEPRRQPRRNSNGNSRSRSSPRRNSNNKMMFGESLVDKDNMHNNSIRDSKNDLDDDDDDDDVEVYIVQQQYGYFSIFFAIVQTVVLTLMIWQCGGFAPFALNPMIGPYPDALSEWGGKNSILILEDNEYYRLVTPLFLHAGIIHLIGNIAVQCETGIFFEREWGSIRWLIIYITSAIGSTILSVIVMPSAISVGSSGAVMGLFGAKLAEVLLRCCNPILNKQDQIAATVRKEQCCVVTISVIIVMAFSFIPFIDWSAHLGGLITGFIVGIVLFSCSVTSQNGCCNGIYKIVWFMIGIICVSLYFIISLSYMYSGEIETIEELRDVCGYYKANYENYECYCMRDEYLQNFYNQNNDNNNGE